MKLRYPTIRRMRHMRDRILFAANGLAMVVDAVEMYRSGLSRSKAYGIAYKAAILREDVLRRVAEGYRDDTSVVMFVDFMRTLSSSQIAGVTTDGVLRFSSNTQMISFLDMMKEFIDVHGLRPQRAKESHA